MDRRCLPKLVLTVVVAAMIAVCPTLAENIDPGDNGSKYAYGENIGWVNAQPLGPGGPGVEVTNTQLTGYMWGENVGWISMSCENTSSCATSSYGVTNNGSGALAGYAWSENLGWISFSCANTSSCATSNYGVTINPGTGDFGGRAWSENAGWITFASTGANPFKVTTNWPGCSSPTGVPLVVPVATTSQLAWSSLPDATIYDVVRGSLSTLRTSAGDFAAATNACLADDTTSLSVNISSTPASGEGFWYLVRAADCFGGSYDSGGAGQSGARTLEVNSAPTACP